MDIKCTGLNTIKSEQKSVDIMSGITSSASLTPKEVLKGCAYRLYRHSVCCNQILSICLESGCEEHM
jgi:hypothetical protein